MTQWVALRPIFEVCARDKGYREGGGHRGDSWWQQEAPENHSKETLEEILWEASKRWSGRYMQLGTVADTSGVGGRDSWDTGKDMDEAQVEIVPCADVVVVVAVSGWNGGILVETQDKGQLYNHGSHR